MKSFNNFLSEAEDLTPERQKLDLGVPSGQQSLPGMGKKKDKPAKPVTPAKGSEYLDPKTGQASDEGIKRFMNKRNTKGYFRAEGKPSAVTPEDVKAGLEKTKVDMQNPEEVQKVRDKINQKYGKPTAQTVSVPVKPRKSADDAFAKKLGLDTPEGAAAAQDAAKDMTADAKKGQTNLKGGPTPQVKPNKTVKPTAPAPAPTAASVRPRGQGSRPVGSTTTRGGAPQLPALKAKPTPVTPAVNPIAKKPVTAKPPELPKIDPETQAPTTKPRPGSTTMQPSQSMTSGRTGSASYRPPTKAEKALANRTQATRVVGQIARPLAQATSIGTGYQAGQARGEGPLTSALRGVSRAAGGGLASSIAGGAALRRLKPGLAVPAAAAAYSAGEMAADSLFNRLKGILKK